MSTKRRPGSPIAKTTNANTKCYVYIYTVFAIGLYLGSTFILIYIYIREVPTDKSHELKKYHTKGMQ